MKIYKWEMIDRGTYVERELLFENAGETREDFLNAIVSSCGRVPPGMKQILRDVICQRRKYFHMTYDLGDDGYLTFRLRSYEERNNLRTLHMAIDGDYFAWSYR